MTALSSNPANGFWEQLVHPENFGTTAIVVVAVVAILAFLIATIARSGPSLKVHRRSSKTDVSIKGKPAAAERGDDRDPA